MKYEEYQAQRAALLAEVQAAQAAKDPKAMNAAMDKVEDLDQKFQAAAVAAANQRAEAVVPAPVNIANMSREIPGGKEFDKMDNNTTVTKTQTMEDVLASKDYRNAYLKTLQGKPLTDSERQSYQNAAMTAPKTIPTETVRRIYGKLADSPMIDAVNVLHIPGNLSIPVQGTVNDADWVAMATAATDKADTITAVSLGAYKLIKTVEITADLSRMAIDEFETWLVNALAKKIRFAVDKAICVGTGSNQATGLLHATDIDNEVEYTSGGMTFADLMAIIAALPSQYRSMATFAMPSALFFGSVLGMVDANKRPVVCMDPQAPAKYRILGYPVILDDNITAGSGLFADFKEAYTFNFAMDPEVSSDQSVAFRSGSTVYRGMCLADGHVVDKAAAVKFKAGM